MTADPRPLPGMVCDQFAKMTLMTLGRWHPDPARAKVSAGVNTRS